MNLAYEQYNMLPKFSKVVSPFFLPCSRPNEKRVELGKFDGNINLDLASEEKSVIGEFIYNHSNSPRFFNFASMIDNIWEDIVVHRRKADEDYTCYIHSAFPNGWYPNRVIGKSFYDTHAPVPGFNLATARQMVDACITKGPFERYVWGLSFDHQQRINPFYEQLKFDINNPILYVKIETQIIVGFPKIDCFLFILRQNFIPEFGIHKPTLLKSLLSMTPEQRIYKSISDDLIKYLER